MITVLTPTFNRESTLPRLAKSLNEQTDQDFEWLVIDDGSIDNTKAVVQRYEKDFVVPVRYFYKENGGKHSALNIGFEMALGEWVFIVDSDDWLDRKCIETIKSNITKLDRQIGSLSFLKVFENGQVIGDEYPKVLENYLDRIKLGISGDKADVFRKDAISKFRFPTYSGENFMAESPMFIWFGQNFKTKFINYKGYICEYQQDGLSDNSVCNRHKSYQSALFVYEIQYSSFSSELNKFKSAANWWRFRIGKKGLEVNENIPKIYFLVGLALFIKDYLKYGKSVVANKA